MKRLFLAVDIDDRTRAAVGHISAGLRRHFNERAKVSWVPPERMHLTVEFFGPSDELAEQRIGAGLTDPVRQQPFALSFDGLGYFPASGPPKVIWLGVGSGLADLQRLQQTIADRLGEAHRKDYRPHLTLGRIRSVIDARGRRQLREATRIPVSAGPCRIDRVTLYESRLSPSGPTYLRLTETPLIP